MPVEERRDSPAADLQRVVILDVGFCNGCAQHVVQSALSPGLIVVPSAPVLVRMAEDPSLRDALVAARVAVIDSGLMVLIWRWLAGVRLQRVSGLKYLQLLLVQPELLCSGNVLWIMPSAAARDQNIAWLRAHGHATTAEDCYVAPQYHASGALQDESLAALIAVRRPRHIILALGGGTQERLGLFLVRRFPDAFAVHCIGAAIGFLSGDQVKIPRWADRLYLGWLFRCVVDPRRFLPRYVKAARLMPMLWKYRRATASGHGEY